jgi:hypothetical protein
MALRGRRLRYASRVFTSISVVLVSGVCLRCISLENRQPLTGLVSSNLTLSANTREHMKRPFRPRTHWIIWLTLVAIAIAALLSFEQGAITAYFK